MNVKRRIFMFGFSCFLGVLTLSLAIIGNNVKLFNGTFSETDHYSIVFDMNNNRLATGSEKPAGYSGSANALSELDNEVTFNYHLLTNPAGRWQTILEGGYFTNIDPIHGIASINITKSDIGAKVGIYWSNNTSFSEDRFSEFATTTNPVSIDFNEYIPNYIKVVSMGAYLNITSMTIELSCSDENPLIGDGTETIYMGMYPQSKVTDDALVGAEGALT